MMKIVKFGVLLLLLCSPAYDIHAHPPFESTALLGSPDPPLAMRTQRVFPRLDFNQPIAFADLPGTGLRAVLETKGVLKAFPAVDDPDPQSVTVLVEMESFGDAIANCRDFTVDPDFTTNGYLYVASNQSPWFVENGSRVSRFTVAKTKPPSIDPTSRLDIITYPSGDHVGTCLRFGPDGYLYVAAGDGSGPFPPDSERAGQNIADLRATIMRIDVRSATEESPYKIPFDNPFVNTPGARGEIFSFGFRNAFRMAFDPANGSLWVADVGWERVEMIHRTHSGANHGWSLYEGPFLVNSDQNAGPDAVLGPGPVIPPAIVLPRGEAQSITGGDFIPQSALLYPGNYLFADYMNGAVWAVDLADQSRPTYQRIADTKLRVVSFGTTIFDGDTVASSLVIDHAGGGIYRLVMNDENSQSDATQTNNFPRKLSDTGLFTSTKSLQPSPGAIRYQPAAAMWRDGAVGDRIVAIPGTDPILANNNRRNYDYPNGTVFANTISREVFGNNGEHLTRRMETQVLAFDGLNWNPYSYRWNDEQTDAELVPASGQEIPITVSDPRFGAHSTTYSIHPRDQCKVCHHVFLQGGISFASGNVATPNWQELVDQGWVRGPKNVNFVSVDPNDDDASIDVRARSYLDINCAHCHMPAGGGTSGLHLAGNLEPDRLTAIDVNPTQGDFAIPHAKIISPGHPEQSVLMYRLATTGAGHMPRLGSTTLDLPGASLIWEWIATMKPNESPTDSATAAALLQWRRYSSTPTETNTLNDSGIENFSSPITAGLFESWVDPAKRVTRVGTNPNIEELLSLSGDAVRGRAWFADSAASQCRSCHRYQGVGQALGPDLDELLSSAGADGTPRTRQSIARQMLFPSEQIAAEYRSVTVLKSDGNVVTGIVAARTEHSLSLKQADGVLITISLDDIDDQRVNDKSMMPDGQLASLTLQEFADLLAMLTEKVLTDQPLANTPDANNAAAEAVVPAPVFTSEPLLLQEHGAGEGPAWHAELGLLSSGEGNINRRSRSGESSIFRENAGSNGLMFDRSGRLVICESVRRRVTRLEHDGTLTVLAEKFNGQRFNQPNDLTIDSKDRIYFTDPRYGDRAGMELLDENGKTVEGVYRIDVDGTVTRIITHEVDRPNGLVVSEDDRFLFVADNNNSLGGARFLWRFNLLADGTVDVASQRLLHDWKTTRGPDGVKLDSAGRLYVAAGLNQPHLPQETADPPTAGIYVLSVDGELIEYVRIPRDETTNCAFGGDDLQTLFITSGGSLWSLRTTVPGKQRH